MAEAAATLLTQQFGVPAENLTSQGYGETQPLVREKNQAAYAKNRRVAFLILKLLKIRHQQSALRLDVLPMEIAREITKQNVGSFIQHVYALPVKLRDSMMVNRIRKALELFETRQVNSEVSTMMGNQSNIDGSRIGGSDSGRQRDSTTIMPR